MAYQPDARGGVFNDIHNKACQHFAAGEHEQCERLCRFLLSHADLNDYHKARCHLFLGMGQDNYLWHTEQAVDLYENLFVVRPGSSYTGLEPPSNEAVEGRQILLNIATTCLASARSEHAAIQEAFDRDLAIWKNFHKRDPTDEELVNAHWAKNGMAEALEHWEQHDTLYQEYLEAAATTEVDMEELSPARDDEYAEEYYMEEPPPLGDSDDDDFLPILPGYEPIATSSETGAPPSDMSVDAPAEFHSTPPNSHRNSSPVEVESGDVGTPKPGDPKTW